MQGKQRLKTWGATTVNSDIVSNENSGPFILWFMNTIGNADHQQQRA